MEKRAVPLLMFLNRAAPFSSFPLSQQPMASWQDVGAPTIHKMKETNSEMYLNEWKKGTIKFIDFVKMHKVLTEESLKFGYQDAFSFDTTQYQRPYF